ncbi:MAG: hypothetical protein RX318_03920 [bacterium]|nr:hypothetical protein [bacterium]
MTPRALLASMTSRELGEWMAYFQLEGEETLNAQLAADASGRMQTRLEWYQSGGHRKGRLRP